MTSFRMPVLVVAAVLSLSVLTACTGNPEVVATVPVTSEPANPTPSPTLTVVPLDPTCENTVTEETLAAFAEAGWTGRKDEGPLTLGGVEIPDGIACLWGDYTVGTDNVSWLMWGRLDDDAAQAAIAGLLDEGEWREEDVSEGVYITAKDPNLYPAVDADGYATTYLFADGQVKGATTKSELSAIVAPEGFAP